MEHSRLLEHKVRSASDKQHPRGKILRSMPSILAVSILVPVLALGGCARHSTSNFKVGSVPDNYKTRHPIVISEKEQTLDIPVSRSSYDLPVASVGAIQGFAGQFRKSASGSIQIMVPSGSPNERAARKIADKIAATVHQTGVPKHRIRKTAYHATEHGSSAPIRLSYSAIQAGVTGCGQWPKDLADTTENRQIHNMGCASQNNLAAMIANPADLLAPRGMSEIDAARRATVIDNYRTGVPTNAENNVVPIPTTFTDG